MYILLGGYKLRGNAESGEKKVEKFTRDQWLSLFALLLMVVLVVGFSYDVGLICFTLAMILILLGTADEKKAIKAIPWSVLILITGVNVLMNITQTMGGIDLLSSILASFMTKRTAGPIMGFTAGIMSWFSSANGVVFPTLIPTVPDIASQVGGASIMQIITAIVCSATVAGISPLSTGGSLILPEWLMVGAWSLLGVVFFVICKKKYKESFGSLVQLISDEDAATLMPEADDVELDQVIDVAIDRVLARLAG